MKNFYYFVTISIVIFSSSLNAQWIQTNGPFGGYVNTLAVSGTAQSISNFSLIDDSFDNGFITDQHSRSLLYYDKIALREYLSKMTFSLTGTTIDRSSRISFTDSIQPVILWDSFESTTIVVQSLTGLGFGAAVFFIPGDVNSGSSESDAIGGGILLLTQSVVAAFAVPSAIYFIGEWMGGNGSYIWTLLGGFSAGGISLLPNIIAGTGDQNAAIIRTAVLVVVGAILGYHLSASTVYESSSSVFIKPRQEVVSQLQIKMIDFFQSNFNVVEFSIEL